MAALWASFAAILTYLPDGRAESFGQPTAERPLIQRPLVQGSVAGDPIRKTEAARAESQVIANAAPFDFARADLAVYGDLDQAGR